MEIHVLGAHNGETRDSKLVSLLVDGILALDAGSLTGSLTMEEQEKIIALILSHHHFDHIRDVATLGLNTYTSTKQIFSPPSVLEALTNHIFGHIYPDFTRLPSPQAPSLRLCPVEPFRPVSVAGYQVLPLPVNHNVPTVGYQVASASGSFFYTSDTGPGFSNLWEHISPHLLITEVTFPTSREEMAGITGHLTPRLLRGELLEIRKRQGRLPAVLVIHMSPAADEEIRGELKGLGRELEASIIVGNEGMKVLLDAGNIRVL